MPETSMNLFDLGVLIIVGLSALLSFYRGFIREVLSLGGWVVASIVTLRFLEPATDFIRPQISSGPIAVAVASISLFLITLILFSIITGMVIKFLKIGEKVGLLDNLAGLCFGVARGALIIAIVFFVMTKFFTNEKDYPKVVQQAVTRPYVEQCAQWIGAMTPNTLDRIMNKKETQPSDDVDPEVSKKQMNELIRTWDKKASAKHNNRTPAEDLPTSSLPSIEDLQQRIRQENEKR
jgi:membrane protein required for colicin V production